MPPGSATTSRRSPSTSGTPSTTTTAATRAARSRTPRSAGPTNPLCRSGGSRCGGGGDLGRLQLRLPLFQLLEHARPVGRDPAGEGGGGDGQRRGEPELAGARAPLVVAVDGAHR